MKTKLTDICKPKQWKTISISQLFNEGYPVYGANGKIGYYSEYTHELPTLMITCRGATCGTVNISEAFSYINGNAMALDNINVEQADIYFLYYYFCFRGFSDVISGSAQPQITRQGLEKIIVDLPKIEKQKQIAQVLAAADSLRRKRKEQLTLLDDYLKSVFLEMFGDPVINEKNWPRMKLNEVGILDRGISKHRPRNAPELLGGSYPLIQTGDVSNSGGYINSYKSTYSEIGLKQSKMWPVGTLCITIAANIAKTGILTFEACFPDSVVGFAPNDLVRTEYIQWWMFFLQKILEEKAPESAQKNINLGILRDLDIPVPHIEIQNKFVKIINQVEHTKQKSA